MYGQGQLLIVDDAPQILSSLTRLLRDESYQIHTATNASEALDVLKQQDVDVVLTDYAMPGMNGAELLNRIAQRYPRTIRLVISGKLEYDTVRDAINFGQAHKFIDKPWDDWGLKETLRDAFRDAALQNLAHEYRQVFEGVQEGLLLVDRQGHIRDANAAFCTLLGYELPMLRHQPARILHLSADGKPYDALYRTVLREGAWEGSLKVRNARGEDLSLPARVKALYDQHQGPSAMVFYLSA
ncbi:MAG: response regulator [Marinobacter sp.]|uniref:ATP-binding response regulator n=1 Tax=Marinobacter sp. TaxID=50741 RepID=UPI00299F28A0|nr:response regulator [Marinobacter sp.]MDX1757704.1 response regulator [Marinobacter sp.]